MTKTGRLSIQNGESRLDGTLLARKGAPDPLGAATSFLNNLGLRDGDCITVSGESGTIGSTTVIFIDSASKAQESLCSGALMATEAMALRAPGTGAGAAKKSKAAAKKKPTKSRATKSTKKKGPKNRG